MKLKKLISNYIYTPDIEQYLKNLEPYNGDTWKIATNSMKEYKTFIKEKMEKIQENKCAYCGFKLNITSNEEIEHIAPKATKLYPEFIFTKYNLVLSCHLCNNRAHKGEKDTIESYSKKYSECEFNIVHPYFDDPDEHYEYLKVKGKAIVFREKSSKAHNSIEMFELNSEARATERAKNLIYELWLKKVSSLEGDLLLEEALTYK